MGGIRTGMRSPAHPLARLLAAASITVAGLAAAAPAHAASPTLAHADSGATTDPLTQAQDTGQSVDIPALTTDTSQTVMNPNGTLTTTISTEPQQVEQNGTWVPVDASLHRNSDGSYSPNAVPNQVTFSGGGTGALVTVATPDGKSFSLTWPSALPTPTANGSTVEYPGVIPGVDLDLTADIDGGFRDVLIVHDATAAANPELKSIQLRTKSSGLTLGVDDAGGLTATDSSGTLVYGSGTPWMWDSTSSAQSPDPGEPATSTAERPGASAQTHTVGLALTSGTLTLTPDLALLTGAGTNYPVFIDPGTGPAPDLARLTSAVNPSSTPKPDGWIEVDNPAQADSTWKGSNYARVGYNGPGHSNCCYVARSTFQFDIPPVLDGVHVIEAHLNATEIWSASSSSDVVYLKQVGVIGPSSTWSNTTPGAPISGPSTPGDWASPPVLNPVPVQFTATSSLQNAADGGWTMDAVALVNSSETDPNMWREFQNNPTMSVTYNNVPYVPASPSTTPASLNPAGCTGASNPGYISTTSPTLSAVVGDKDTANGQSVRGLFRYWDASTMTSHDLFTNSFVSPPSGSTTLTDTSPALSLADGQTYLWNAATEDNSGDSASNTSPWMANNCYFRVDATDPNPPTPVSTDWPASGSGSTPTLHAGQSGTITATATDTGTNPSGIWCYAYSLDSTISTGTTPCTGTGYSTTGTITVTPPNWGTHTLTVQAIDKAGNRSMPAFYNFYVPDSPNVTTPVPGDLTGDMIPDLAYADTNGNLIVQAGNTDPATSTGTFTAATADQSPLDASSGSPVGWNHVLFAHRVTMHGKNVDDLLALQPGSPTLYEYNNDGTGHFSTSIGYTSIIKPGTCDATCAPTSPTDYTQQYNADWSHVLSMAAVGDTTNGNPYNSTTKLISGKADLVTIESNGNGDCNLWLYHGANNSFRTPKLIGAGGWCGYSLVAPGDATGDGLPDLWARDTNTGQLWQFTNALCQSGQTGCTPGAEDPVTLGGGTNGTPVSATAATRTQIGTGFTATAYPQLASVGDANGDGHPDLYATTAYGNQLTYFPGQPITGGNALGSAAPVTSVNWAANTSSLETNNTLQPPSGALTLAITRSGTKLCLDNYQGTLANGNKTQLYACNGSPAQQWTVQSDGTIHPDNSSTYCLGTAASKTDNDTLALIVTCSPTNSTQKWQSQPNGSLTNKAAQRCLTDSDASTADGAQLLLWDCNNGPAQNWALPGSGPVGRWKLNEAANSTSAADSITPADATAYGTVTFGNTPVRGGTSAGFNGNSALITSHTIIDTTKSYTVSAWINPINLTTSQMVASQGGTNQQAFYLGYFQGVGWGFEQLTADTTTTPTHAIARGGVYTAQAGVWTHLVGVYDSTTGTLSLYVNGNLAGTDTNTTPFASGPLTIGGAAHNGNTNTFNNLLGYAADIQTYNRALTQAQVNTLYSTGITLN